MADFRLQLTQYMRPNGRQEDTSIMVSAELGELATAVLADPRVRRFAVEVLMTDVASFTLELKGPSEPDPINLLVANGPGVIATVEKLIRQSHRWVTTGELPDEEVDDG